MSTQAIIEKAEALKTEEEQSASNKKRTGAWVEEEVFEDKDSGLAVVIRKRIRGRPAYSVSLVHYDEKGPNRYIPFPLRGLNRPLFEVAYLLMKTAEEYMEAHPLHSRRDKRKDKKRGESNGKGKSREGGLSALAKADAQEHGHEHVGKTARKRKKKGRSQ